MRFERVWLRAACGVWAAAVLVAAGGCDLFFNQTASLGGDTAGGRGTVQVLFINNTAHRAVFTTGTYDQLDQGSVPDFTQFTLDEDTDLAADTSSEIGEFDCGRVFSVGGQELLDFIESNSGAQDLDADAFSAGVHFYAEDDQSETGFTEMGNATALEALLGIDFPCEALLIVRFEPGAADDEFRVDFELIPSESTR